MMSTDLLSMDYEGARDRRWFASAARLGGRNGVRQRPSAKEQSSCGWPMKEKPGGLPSRARVTNRKRNGRQGLRSLSGGRGLIVIAARPTSDTPKNQQGRVRTRIEPAISVVRELDSPPGRRRSAASVPLRTTG
jgi:hypothetical protein